MSTNNVRMARRMTPSQRTVRSFTASCANGQERLYVQSQIASQPTALSLAPVRLWTLLASITPRHVDFEYPAVRAPLEALGRWLLGRFATRVDSYRGGVSYVLGQA